MVVYIRWSDAKKLVNKALTTADLSEFWARNISRAVKFPDHLLWNIYLRLRDGRFQIMPYPLHDSDDGGVCIRVAAVEVPD